MLMELAVADYPNMKKADRNKLHREIHKKAYPKTYNPTEVLTTEELAKRIKAAHG
jgi:hypothetical protein